MLRTLSHLLLFFVPFSVPFCTVGQEMQRTDAPSAVHTPNASPTSDAQEHVKGRLRIGVALEGGGALGLAHIGVLEWFEEHHIPIDEVAGTSMGGLVGGFYATGMTPAELKKLIEGVDWNGMLGGATPYEDLSFRRKEDQRAFPNAFILGLRNGLSLPPGLNSGHQIGLLIDRITIPYYKLGSFETLPTPFRCVATDLVSGKEVVFEQGSLALALRSTMSIPGAFAPVVDKDRVLVDGGLLNNLPTDVVKQMGADIVIAVHLDTKPVEAAEIRSLFTVLQQSVRVVVAESEMRGLAQADAVISVPLAGYSATDYRKNEAIMRKGYETADTKAELLEKFALSDAEWKDYVRDRQARKETLSPVPQFIKVGGADTQQQTENIEHYLAPLAGKPLDTDKLDRALTRLAGVGRYDAVGYRITERDGQQGLLVQVSEKNYAPPTIQPAFEVDGSESE